MPRRYLSPSIARDKLFNRIAALDEFAALLDLMALPTNDSEELLTTLCPGRRDKDPGDVARAIAPLTTECDERGHTLLEYGPDGRLRYPPSSFYTHQTYIADGRRTVLTPAPSAGGSESLLGPQHGARPADSFSRSTPLRVSESSKSASSVPHPTTRGGSPVALKDALDTIIPTPDAFHARERGALTAVWSRALGLTTDQRNARNRGALFRATVNRLCAEQGIDLHTLAPAPAKREAPSVGAAPRFRV